MGRLDSGDTHWHRRLETDHRWVDRHDLTVHVERVAAFLQRLADLLRGLRLEHSHDLPLQRLVRLPDRGGIRLRPDEDAGELLPWPEDAELFRIRLLEEDVPEFGEGRRGLGRRVLDRDLLHRPSEFSTAPLSLLRDRLDELLDDGHGPFELRLDPFASGRGPVEPVDAQP